MENLGRVVADQAPESNVVEVVVPDNVTGPHVERVAELMGSPTAATAVNNMMMRVFN